MNTFRAFSAAFLLAAVSAIVTVDAQTTLPPVNVEANYCDYAVNCTFSSGMDAFLVPIGPAFPPNADSISPDDNPLIATCNSLRNRAAQIGCDTSNPPPAPGFPSPTRGSWAPNGCGDDSWLSNVARQIHDLDNPLPGVSFRKACDDHDRCYHLWEKKGCDGQLARDLSEVCSKASDAVACLNVATLYTDAVVVKGQAAWESDHLNMECAKISQKLRDGDCMS